MTKRLIALGLAGVALIAASTVLLSSHLTTLLSAESRDRDFGQLRAAQAEVERGREAELRLRAGMLASDAPTIAYIADALQAASNGGTVDSASISDLLADRREQLGLDTVGVISVEGRWIAGTRPWTDGSGSPAGHSLFQQARDSQQPSVGLVREDRRLFLALIEPMVRAGTVDAYLYAGSELDSQYLSRLAALAPVDLALVARAKPMQVLLQSGEPADTQWLALADGSVDPSDAQALSAPVYGHAEQAIVLARIRPGDTAASRVWPAFLVLAGIATLLWVVLLLTWWRTTLAPLATACELLERAAAGDFHLRAPAWPNGVRGRFAVAFDSLMLRLGGAAQNSAR